MKNIPAGLESHSTKGYAHLKQIPFEMIDSPHYGDDDDIKFDLHEYPHCIVAEKHGWSMKYTSHIWEHGSCLKCAVFSEKFDRNTEKDEQDFVRLLEQFVEHCEKRH